MKRVAITVVKGMTGAGLLLLLLCCCQEGKDPQVPLAPGMDEERPPGMDAQVPLAPGMDEERPPEADSGRWLAGDFHNHTYLSDGGNVPDQVFAHAFQFGLDWIANSEHGGAFNRTPNGEPWPAGTVFLGAPPAGMMWRWQSLWQYSFPLVMEARTRWPDKLIVQAYEWNVPGHDHASVAIVGPVEEGGLAVARHEYLFDDKDSGRTADSSLGTSGKMAENTHEKAVAGVRWLDQYYPGNSYFLINHPSRWQNYSIAAMRDFHDTAPNVAFGFEGMPGHQKASCRGHYDGGPFRDNTGQDVTFKARTYGGADYMLAKVGGVWDALLGEGRRFFVFVNSDFHTTEHDFWPGEYSKNYTHVRDLNHDGRVTPDELVAGLRSGNSFIVQGDLIDGLQFSVRCRQKMAGAATAKDGLMPGEPGMAVAAEMGGTLEVQGGCEPQMIIRFRSPPTNNNGEAVTVDHIDLIAGEVKGKVPKVMADGVTPNPAYEPEVNDSSRVVASFTREEWQEETIKKDGSGDGQGRPNVAGARDGGSGDGQGRPNVAGARDGGSGDGQGRPNTAGARDGGSGWQTIVYPLPRPDRDCYFRLRGTNLGRGVANETDDQGNPLSDELLAPNTKDKAYADLWFYSNPIFVRVGR